MNNSQPSTGEKIDARCTKCRKNTTHTIITMETENPVQVQCTKCQRQHGYRPPTVAKANPTSARQTALQKDTERKEWELLRPGMNGAKARIYSMTEAYKLRTLINHPTFGLGMVQRLVGSQKIEVLFEDGIKTMRCK